MAANKVITNTIANISAKVWGFISLYVFVPIWVHMLGVEAYGVIAFYTIMMTIMHFADAGLTGTLTREFGRGDRDVQYRRDLLRTIETLYMGIALVLFLVVFFCAGIITDTFLKADTIPKEELVKCVRIMSFILPANFMYSLYNGGLMGLQKQVQANMIAISYSMSRGAFVILLLMLWPNLTTFLYWQLFSMVGALVVTRVLLGKHIEAGLSNSNFRLGLFKSIWKFAFGMMLMSLTAALNTQLDKLVTSNVISLQGLGYYSLASSLSQIVVVIVLPIGAAFYPELTRLVTTNYEKVKKPFLAYTYGVSIISTIVGMTIFFYIDEISFLWTQKEDVMLAVHTPARILAIGNIVLALQHSSYYLGLANGHTKSNVILGIAQIIFLMPTVYYFTKNWGINGAPIPYAIINLCGAIYFGFVLIGRFFREHRKEWLIMSLTPLLINILIIGVGFSLSLLFSNMFAKLVFALLFAMISAYISVYTLLHIRKEYVSFIPTKLKKILFV